MIVVSDTSAICYLILIDEVHLLPALFGEIQIPQRVLSELRVDKAPAPVRTWTAEPPTWLKVHFPVKGSLANLGGLDLGEIEALSLAVRLPADLVILDDRAARQAARVLGLRITGLLGILDQAAKRQLVDLKRAVLRLRQTSFRVAPRLLRDLLELHLNPSEQNSERPLHSDPRPQPLR